MLLALVVAVLAVALGAALTAVSGARPVVLGLLRTFAAAAAAAVVLTHLLPDALTQIGLWGALCFLIGVVGPLLLHPLTELLAARRAGLSPTRIALEAGFIGLLLHHVGDGLGIGAYAALPGGVTEHFDVVLALIAHTVPLVAVVTLAYRGEYGLRAALFRAGALALASVVGVLGSFAVPTAALTSASAWIGALVSGVLLHVVTHDWLEDLPTSEPAKLADLLAAAAGLSLAFIGGHEPGHAAEGNELLEAALGIALRTAPFLLIGLILAFFLQNSVRELLGRLGSTPPVALGSQLGFTIGAEGLALGLVTYGVVWTLAALVATLVLPVVAGAVAMLAVAIGGAQRLDGDSIKVSHQEHVPHGVQPQRLYAFDRATTLWVVGVAVAALFQVSLPSGALFGSLGSARELLVAGALGSLIGTGGPIVIALGALTEKGLSPGAALLGVALSSALGVRALLELWRRFGRRALTPALIWLVSLTGALAIAVNNVAPVPAPLGLPREVGQASASLLLLLIVLRAERVGLRRWLAGWFEQGAEHRHHHHSSEMANGSAVTMRSPEASGPSAEA